MHTGCHAKIRLQSCLHKIKDKRKMKKTILLILMAVILCNVANANLNHYYEIKLKYNQGNITLKSIQVKPIINEEDLENIEGGYIAEAKSFDDKLLNLTFFNIPLKILYDSINNETGEINGGGIIELNQSEVIIKVPYFENAKEINIYDINISKKLKIDVSDYAKSSAKQQSVAEPEQKKNIPIKEEIKSAESKNNYLFYTLIVLMAIIILAMIYLLRKRK